MSTDNSRILTSDAQRSMFGIHNPVKDTGKLGSIKVSDCQFAFPKDTVKHRVGRFYELKPTTHRLASKITANTMSVAVPLRSIWRYYDEFISKGSHIVQSGGLNVPYIQQTEDKSSDEIPQVDAAKLLCYALLNLSGDAGKLCAYDPINTPDTTEGYEKVNGNAADYDFDFVDWQGILRPSARAYKSGAYIPYLRSSLMPRLVGDGVSSNRMVNVNWLYDNRNADIVYHFYNPEAVMQAQILFELIKIVNPSATFELQTGDIRCFDVHISQPDSSGRVYFHVGFGSHGVRGFSSLVPDELVGTSDFSGALSSSSHYLFYVNAPYGCANNIVWNENTIDSALTGSVLGDYSFVNFHDSLYIAKLATSFAITQLLNHSSLFGYGSLCESFGHHFFENVTLRDLYTDYVDSVFDFAGFWGAYDPETTIPVLNRNILGYIRSGESGPMMNMLPYVAYQKTVTDRFLLPHQILSNNSGEDSTLDYSKYDSPYFRNNMVPTLLFGKPLEAGKNWLQSQTIKYFAYDGQFYRDPQEASVVDAVTEDLHFRIPVMQMLHLFVDRGALMDMDVFTKIWQKQDRNVTDLLNQSSYGVNADGSINAKQFLMATAASKYLNFGGTDQLAKDVIENQFGVHSVPDCLDRVIVLDAKQNDLEVQEVLNQGGATDSEGNSMALGDRVSICTNAIPVETCYDCFCPDFTYLLDLHWFSVATERVNVPNAGVRKLEVIGSDIDPRKAFQIALFPAYQSSGDEMLKLADIESFAPESDVAWTNKNNTLKDGYMEYRGEWKNKYEKQIVTPYPQYRKGRFAPSLTYAYLQPTPFQFDLHLVDRYGDAFQIAFDNYHYKKSTMTKLDNIGIEGM